MHQMYHNIPHNVHHGHGWMYKMVKSLIKRDDNKTFMDHLFGYLMFLLGCLSSPWNDKFSPHRASWSFPPAIRASDKRSRAATSPWALVYTAAICWWFGSDTLISAHLLLEINGASHDLLYSLVWACAHPQALRWVAVPAERATATTMTG